VHAPKKTQKRFAKTRMLRLAQLTFFRKALAEYAFAGDSEAANVSRGAALLELARVGPLDEREKRLAESLEQFRKNVGEKSAFGLYNLGRAHAAAREWEEAEAQFRECLSSFRQPLAESERLCVARDAAHNLQLLLLRRGDRSGAREVVAKYLSF
jgi:tetratricopeptide (TPR) repeat protein